MNGTLNMVKSAQKKEPSNSIVVFIVATNSKVSILTEKIKILFVATIAKPHIEESRVLIMKHEFAKSAEENIKQTNTPIRAGVRLVGLQSIERCGTAEVYNMEVEGTHNFAVNGGFIVHNCMDSARYFVQTMGIGMKAKRKAVRW